MSLGNLCSPGLCSEKVAGTARTTVTLSLFLQVLGRKRGCSKLETAPAAVLPGEDLTKHRHAVTAHATTAPSGRLWNIWKRGD